MGSGGPGAPFCTSAAHIQGSPAVDAAGAADLQQRIDTAIGKAKVWLLANKPHSTEDRVFHLHGLVDGGLETKEIETARQRLLKEQQPDGSWAQLTDMPGDAYATATVLVALRRLARRGRCPA